MADKRLARVLVWLEGNEWGMGNGQCPDCEGLSPHTDWGAWREELKGHKSNCVRAEAIQLLRTLK